MFPESPDCTLYDDTKRNGFWVTGGEPGVIEVLKVWKWPIVHRSKFWPICVLTAFRPSFPHLETLKKNIGKLNSLTVRKKKKKKSWPTPIFKFWSGEGNITIFFFGLMGETCYNKVIFMVPTPKVLVITRFHCTMEK